MHSPIQPRNCLRVLPGALRLCRITACLSPAELGCRHGEPSLASSVSPSSGINLQSVGSTLNALCLPRLGSGNQSDNHKQLSVYMSTMLVSPTLARSVWFLELYPSISAIGKPLLGPGCLPSTSSPPPWGPHPLTKDLP